MTFSWREFRQQPWRTAAAVLAVLLGVALAFSVQLINASALDEFAQAVRSVSGQADLSLRATQDDFDEALYARVARLPGTAEASPLLEVDTLMLGPQTQTQTQAQAGSPLRVYGVDALRLATLSPELMPRPAEGADRLDVLRPGRVFLNAAAQARLAPGTALRLQTAQGPVSLVVAGSQAAEGGPSAVMDIAAAQALFGRIGRLSRIDLRLHGGVDRDAYLHALALPDGVLASAPGDGARQIDQLSRAYRVNLTVLALVALFTGAFLVFSVLSLSVARRTRQLALLGVLGLRPRERAALVLAEAMGLGLVGSLLGLLAGSALAALALRLLGGDLGGGYFSGATPSLRWSPLAALLYGALGVAAAVGGAIWPARAAATLPPAQALKGLGLQGQSGRHLGPGLGLLGLAGLLALSPPWWGLPVAAYLSVASLLLGGIVLLPSLLSVIEAPWTRRLGHHALALLALERARRSPSTAAAAIGGVVASLSLAVALTVMVGSFRQSVSDWLGQVLPAPLYLHQRGSAQAAELLALPPDWVARALALPEVGRASRLRLRSLQLSPGQPRLGLVARELDPDPRRWPLQGEALPAPEGCRAIYVSQAVSDLYGARVGQRFEPLARAWGGLTGARDLRPCFFVAGLWRDYARQFGTIVIGYADYLALSGDARVNDLALWPAAGIDEARLAARLSALGTGRDGAGPPLALEISSSAEIRARSMKIFDRSFAITYWLQAVAIGIGLFGVAASFSAQILARRKEFGLLAHLGLTRRQILQVVAGEGLVWTAVGALAGLVLGLAVAVLLVKVVNPQSFHWSMDLHLPWGRLLGLALGTVGAGTLTAWLAGRAAASPDAVAAVREDW